MDAIVKANSACGLSNMALRMAIRSTKAAIVEMKCMRDSGEVPADCMENLTMHIEELRNSKNEMRKMIEFRKDTCRGLTDCLAGGGIIITPQDGGK